MYMLVVAFMVQLLHLRYPLGGLHKARMVVVEKISSHLAFFLIFEHVKYKHC